MPPDSSSQKEAESPRDQRRLHPTKSEYRGHVWTWDFIHDSTVKGGSFRTLSVVGEDTLEAYELHPARKIGSNKILKLLGELMDRQGAPDHIRSDNGSEFVVKSWQSWLAGEMIKTLSIDPGCPWQNGLVESFHDKFRRGCLPRELFYTLSEVRVVIAGWKQKYHELQPHRSLGMKTPEEFVKRWDPGGDGGLNRLPALLAFTREAC